jgi:hypothetical protein
MAEDPPEVSAAQLAGLLAADDRLKVAAALVLGATSAAQIAEASGLDAGTAVKALERLRAGGLAEASPSGGYRLRSEAFRDAAKAASPKRDGDGEGDPVLRRLFDEGRLKSIPSSKAKRLVVLDHLAQMFEPGRRYPEAEVNAALLGVHPDAAALRRYLVDEAFMERAEGLYWRAGGTLEVD